ncbi:hypothetical protein Lysil_1490 [Lysobacter silvestris]|uniref:Uncharacterized protein n=1 Tax=Solilutibacter silvestris TaxID=1645665 RepID=A0A2K1PWZ2_9GAMM|nr:hypothetical protein Lysil_1490 [Lysobacter silvestris]
MICSSVKRFFMEFSLPVKDKELWTAQSFIDTQLPLCA